MIWSFTLEIVVCIYEYTALALPRYGRISGYGIHGDIFKYMFMSKFWVLNTNWSLSDTKQTQEESMNHQSKSMNKPP